MFLKRDKQLTFKHKIKVYFITGLIVALPILGSFWILSILFVKLTDFIYRYVAPTGLVNVWVKLLWRLLTLVILFGIVVFIGLFARNYLGGKLIRVSESLLSKVPVLNKIYTALRQILESFWGDKNAVFRSAVLVEFPRDGVYSMGFTTSEAMVEIQNKIGEDTLSVFIPSSPSPTSGFFVMVSKEKLVELNISIEDALKMILSGGMVAPKKLSVISLKF
jgi:uncharacterized membrane protein